jgi:hypothetical protein
MRTKCIWKSSREETIWQTWANTEYNIRMDLIELGCEGVDWIHLAQGRFHVRVFGNTVMNFPFSQMAGNFMTS